MAYGPAPAWKALRMIAEVTPGTTPATAMDVFPVETAKPTSVGITRTNPGNVQADREHRDYPPVTFAPGLQVATDFCLKVPAYAQAISGVTDRTAFAAVSHTASDISIGTTGPLRRLSKYLGWGATLTTVPGLYLVSGFVTAGTFWVYVTSVVGDDAFLDPALPIPADEAAGASVTVKLSRGWKSTATSDATFKSSSVELWGATQAKGEVMRYLLWTKWGINVPRTGVIKQSFEGVSARQPSKITAQLANATTSTTWRATSAGRDWQGQPEPEVGGVFRLGGATFDSVAFESYGFEFLNPAILKEGAGAGIGPIVAHRDNMKSSSVTFAFDRATAQSDTLVDYFRDADTEVSHAVGWRDSGLNRSLVVIPRLCFSDEDLSGIKQSDTDMVSVKGWAKNDTTLGASWIYAEVDA